VRAAVVRGVHGLEEEEVGVERGERLKDGRV
jgi:hypothetical protein